MTEDVSPQPRETPPALPGPDREDAARKGRAPAPSPREIRVDRLPARMLEIIRETPPKEYYKLRLVRGTHDESIQLVKLVAILNHLLDTAPGLCFGKMGRGEVKGAEVDVAWRAVRTAIGALEDAMRTIARISGAEVRAWKKVSPARKEA